MREKLWVFGWEKEAEFEALFLMFWVLNEVFLPVSSHCLTLPHLPFSGTPHSAIMKALSAQWSTVKRLAQQQQPLAPHREEDQAGGEAKAPFSPLIMGSQPEGSGVREGGQRRKGSSFHPPPEDSLEDHTAVGFHSPLSPSLRRRLSMAAALDSPGASCHT